MITRGTGSALSSSDVGSTPPSMCLKTELEEDGFRRTTANRANIQTLLLPRTRKARNLTPTAYSLSIIRKRTANPQSLPAKNPSSPWPCAPQVCYRRFLMQIVDPYIRVHIWGYVSLTDRSSDDLRALLTAREGVLHCRSFFSFS